MNWDRIEGNWKQLKGSVKERWGTLTGDQLEVVAGRRASLTGRIQESCGICRDEAHRQLNEWQKRMKEQVAPGKAARQTAGRLRE